MAKYEKMIADNDAIEMVLVSADQDEAGMTKFMTKAKAPFPAVKLSQVSKLSLVTKHQERGIPDYILLDAEGELITGDDALVFSEIDKLFAEEKK